MEKREITTIVLSTAALCLAAAIFSAPGPATATGSATGTSATGSATVTTAPATGTAPAASPGAATAAVPGEFSDAEIMDLVLAVDGNEVAAANVAMKKKLGKDAMGYAKMLRKAHSKDSSKVMKLSRKLKLAPAASPTSTELRAKGARELEAMAGKDGAEFEAAYVDAMVKGHTEALALLDDRLLKYADNEDLKKQLAETRHHVADHLEQGKRLHGASAAREP